VLNYSPCLEKSLLTSILDRYEWLASRSDRVISGKRSLGVHSPRDGLTANLHEVSRLRMRGAAPLLPRISLWLGAELI
jgi:hypothetical protein